MELVLRDGQNELCIDHQDGNVGFIVLTGEDKQLNFSIELAQWDQLKTFINDSIYKYEQDLKIEASKEKQSN